MLYVEDADAQRELTHIHNNHLNKVCTFKPISVKTTTNALQLNMPSFEFQADLPEIAGRYVYKHLLVPKSHPSSKCPSYLCALALRYVRPHNADEQLESFMKEEPKHREERLRLIVENIVHQRAMAIVANNRASLSAHVSIQHDEESLLLPVGTFPVGITEAVNVPSTKKQQRNGAIDFHEIALVGKAKGSEKLDLIIALSDKMKPCQYSDVTERARQFHIKFVKPIMTCLGEHHNSDKDKFLCCHPQFLHTKFLKGCGCTKKK